MKKIRIKQAQKNKYGLKTSFIWQELEDKYGENLIIGISREADNKNYYKERLSIIIPDYKLDSSSSYKIANQAFEQINMDSLLGDAIEVSSIDNHFSFNFNSFK